MLRRYCLHAALLLFLAVPIVGLSLEGDQLYRISTVRAAPGSLAGILEWAVAKNTVDFYVMRHAQGDQWDLMFVTPMKSVNLDPIFTEVESMIDQHDFSNRRGNGCRCADDRLPRGPGSVCGTVLRN